VQDEKFREPPLKISGDADRWNHRDGNDDFRQPRALFQLFDAGEKERLFANIAAAMGDIPDAIEERQCKLFDQVHVDYGAGVRAARVTFKGRNPSISAPTDQFLADASA
jgi:catalase